MKTLKWLLLIVCALKSISFIFCFKFNQDSREINRFFEKELSRKYNEHWMNIGNMLAISEECDFISRDSTNHYLGNPNEDRWPEFKRTRFQDYARYLRTLDSVGQPENDLILKNFPKLLQNTIAEESAKREIFLHYKNFPTRHMIFENVNLIGLISDVDLYPDSMQVHLVPFWYETKLQFDNCQCGTHIMEPKSIPFIYTGSLVNWKCTYHHPKTKEIQIDDLQTIE